MVVFGGVLVCLVLFAAMLVLLEVGFRLGMRFEKARGGEATSIFDSAVFALLGLLLGFAFAGAVDRLDNRRELIVEEANAISTAYLRLDLLAPEDQPPSASFSAPIWNHAWRPIASSIPSRMRRFISGRRKGCNPKSGWPPSSRSTSRIGGIRPRSCCLQSTR